MKNIKLLLSLTLFLSFCIQLRAQNPSQGVNGNIDDVTINNDYLSGEKIRLSNGATTNVKYYIDMSRSSSGANTWHPVNMKVGLGYKENNVYKFFDGAYTFKNEDFGQYNATLYRELTSVVDHSKLPAGAKIYILYENHRPNVPESGWLVEAYALNSTVVAFDFVLSIIPPTEPEPEWVVGTPPVFTAPVPGAVPLYEYGWGIKSTLTTVYYSSYPAYSYNGIFGYVFVSQEPGTVPLHRYVRDSNGNNYYTTNQGTYAGYSYKGILCYVYANQVTKTLPVYEHSRVVEPGLIYRYSNDPNNFDNYSNDDAKFYILQNRQVTTYPLPEEDCAELYQYYSNSYQDHLYTTTRYPNGNYYYERVLGYVYTIQKTGTVALYRYWNPSIQDHYYTTTRNPSGTYVYEGITGYVYPSSGVSGTVGIYSHYSSSATDHYYNNVYSNHATYDNEGVKFYMMQYNH